MMWTTAAQAWVEAKASSASVVPMLTLGSGGAAGGNADWWHAFWFGNHEAATPSAGHTEALFMFILWVNIISFVLLMAIMGWFTFKYRRGNQATNYQVSAAHNTPLELAWSIIPLLVMVPIFYFGFKGYIDKLASPADAEEIMVRGQKWNWNFTYRNGGQALGDQWMTREINPSKTAMPIFVVPEGRPIRLVMSSSDVIHAFYIPDYRMKMDVIPNRYTSMTFTPEKTGQVRDHRVFCAEYCGDQHSEMAALLRVVPQDQYAKLLVDFGKGFGDDTTVLKVGEITYQQKCSSCHSLDGTKGTGPSWKNVYGRMEPMADGKPMMADENYLRESILYPAAHIVAGYGNQMPSFQGQLSPLQLDALILFIKSLSDKTPKDDMGIGEKKIKELPDKGKDGFLPKDGDKKPA